MNAVVYKICRSGNFGEVVYRFLNGPVEVFRFPASMPDAEVLKKIGAMPEEEENNRAEVPAAVPVMKEPEEEQPKRKESVNDVRAKKHALKEKYLSDLKKAGIDKSKEPSFARIEAAWKKHCCK